MLKKILSLAQTSIAKQRGQTQSEIRDNIVIMIKTLQRHGNSQALVLEKPLLEALGIEKDTPLQVTVSGNSLIVSPVHVGLGREEVGRSLQKLRPRYSEMLQRLTE